MAQADTPAPRSLASSGRPRYLAEAPVAIITVCASNVVSPSITTFLGEQEKSTSVAIPVRISAPKRSACFLISSIISTPEVPSG